MTNDSYIYYAMVDEDHPREEPFAVIRRQPFEGLKGGGWDEVVSPGTEWEPTTFLIEAEHGDTQFEFIEIDEAEVDRLVEYFRALRRAWQESQGQQPQQG